MDDKYWLLFAEWAKRVGLSKFEVSFERFFVIATIVVSIWFDFRPYTAYCRLSSLNIFFRLVKQLLWKLNQTQPTTIYRDVSRRNQYLETETSR